MFTEKLVVIRSNEDSTSRFERTTSALFAAALVQQQAAPAAAFVMWRALELNGPQDAHPRSRNGLFARVAVLVKRWFARTAPQPVESPRLRDTQGNVVLIPRKLVPQQQPASVDEVVVPKRRRA